MSKILNPLRSYTSYAFFAVGLVWIIVAFTAKSYLVFWPVITCFTSGILLLYWRGKRLTWAWASSTAVMGLAVSGYQAYLAMTIIGGVLSSLAAISAGAFTVFALVHLLLLYAGNSVAPETK